jgi:thioredoxin reductase
MDLKSAGFATTLYDPTGSLTLKRYCQERGIPYADLGHRVKLETFSAYGTEFQRRFVPDLDPQQVSSIERCNAGFELQLDSGDRVEARRVIVATGISHFAYIPPVLSGLPEAAVTHSSRHHLLDRFRGIEVAVIGSGASAVDFAAMLHEAGASVHLVARRRIQFPSTPPRIPRPFWEELRHPTTGLGAGWRSLLCVKAPLLFHLMPQQFRHTIVRRHLGPSPSLFMKDRVIGKFAMHDGWTVNNAQCQSGRIRLELAGEKGQQREVAVEHVIACTGYRVNLRRLTFLTEAIQSSIRLEGASPALSSNFESSIPGLYFVGPAAAPSFGPLLRFACGAGFTARRLARHLTRIS